MVTAEPEPVLQSNPAHVAAVPLTKQLSVFEQELFVVLLLLYMMFNFPSKDDILLNLLGTVHMQADKAYAKFILMI